MLGCCRGSFVKPWKYRDDLFGTIVFYFGTRWNISETLQEILEFLYLRTLSCEKQWIQVLMS